MSRDALEYIGDVRNGVDLVLDARSDDGEKTSDIFARILIADEKVVFASKGYATKGRFASVVIEWQLGNIEKASQRLSVA